MTQGPFRRSAAPQKRAREGAVGDRAFSAFENSGPGLAQSELPAHGVQQQQQCQAHSPHSAVQASTTAANTSGFSRSLFAWKVVRQAVRFASSIIKSMNSRLGSDGNCKACEPSATAGSQVQYSASVHGKSNSAEHAVSGNKSFRPGSVGLENFRSPSSSC